MQCAWVSERLSAYLDGETTAVESREVGRHLTACAVCRAELAALQRLHEALAGLAVAAPPDLARQVRRRLHPRRAVWWRAMTLAASLVLGITVGGGLTKQLYYLPANGNATELAALEEVFQDFPPGSLGGNGMSYQEDEDGGA